MKTKLLENIEAKMTGRQKYVPSRICQIAYDEVDPSYYNKIDLDVATECRIGIELGSNVFISDIELKESNGKVLEEVKLKLGQSIADYVYGDLRTKLINLSIELRARHGPGDDGLISIVNDLLEMIDYDG